VELSVGPGLKKENHQCKTDVFVVERVRGVKEKTKSQTLSKRKGGLKGQKNRRKGNITSKRHIVGG